MAWPGRRSTLSYPAFERWQSFTLIRRAVSTELRSIDLGSGDTIGDKVDVIRVPIFVEEMSPSFFAGIETNQVIHGSRGLQMQ